MSANVSETLAVSEAQFFEPIDALHRGDNSFIGFLRKNGESATGVENLFAATKEQVRAMLPSLAHWLLQDAYLTVNGFNSTAPYNVKKTGLPGVWRKEKNLRYLNAVYADLDIGRAGESGPRGLSVNDASQVLIDLLTGGTIPQLSMSAQSGQGLYAFWLLRDDDDENAPVTFKGQRNFVETLALYKKVNRAIYKRLECLAADKICDGARVLRVPGTRHSVTGEQCFYKVTFDSQGQLVTYTLRELAAAFGVPVLEKSLPRELRQWTANENSTCPQRAAGPKALAAARARDLVTLEQWRGGWTKGNRRFSLRLYAQFLRAAGVPYSDAAQAVETMAGNCKPAYPSDASDQTLKVLLNEVWREPFAKYTQLKLVHWLQITPDAARELELERLLPVEVQDERQPPKGGTQAANKAARQIAIQALIETRGLLSEREFVHALQAQGIDASKATARRDLIALGYQDSTARKKAGRPNSQMTLPDTTVNTHST
jgi:hypothetical protein